MFMHALADDQLSMWLAALDHVLSLHTQASMKHAPPPRTTAAATPYQYIM